MAICCLPFISGCKQSECAVEENLISDALYRNLPFEMPKVQQPAFPAYEVNIEKFGAKGDGLFLNTKAINDAIKDVNQHGGGKVIIPEGIWLTGPIELLVTSIFIRKETRWYSSPVTLKHTPLSPLLLKGWKPAVANLLSQPAMRKISLSQDTVHSTETVTAGGRSKKES